MISLIFILTTIVHIADWLQTRWISKNGKDKGFWETNVFLGTYPSLATVNIWFVTAFVLLTVLVFNLPFWYGLILVLGWFIVEIYHVISNYKKGIGVLGWS